jgi:phytoene dehydrogenase-like protein
MRYDMIIVGGGIAGLTAACYGSKASRSVLLLEQGEHLGGLVGSFDYLGYTLDQGIRAFENSGIVKPMLQQLGIQIDWIKSPVTIGFMDEFFKLVDEQSITGYEELLVRLFPNDQEAVHEIIEAIKKVMGYMDVLYGIDNPLFVENMMDMRYVSTVLLPWFFKYKKNVKEAMKLQMPINDFLAKITTNEALIDMISQHFFLHTPAFFALSYFSLYLDYNYPLGGTRTLPQALASYARDHGAVIQTNTKIIKIHPHDKKIIDSSGNHYEYKELIWAADMRSMVEFMNLEQCTKKEQKKLYELRSKIQKNHGGDSVITCYFMVDMDPSSFVNPLGPHCFYTASLQGTKGVRVGYDTPPTDMFELMNSYLETYYSNTTYEISIPALRDPSLAPQGKTALIVSALMDYSLVKQLDDAGHYQRLKEVTQEAMTKILEGIIPNFRKSIEHTMLSTPKTIQSYTSNFEGAITGWAFGTNSMPSVTGFKNILKTVQTPIHSILQAGQWSFSPSGLPISILTGRVAADKAIKKTK